MFKIAIMNKCFLLFGLLMFLTFCKRGENSIESRKQHINAVNQKQSVIKGIKTLVYDHDNYDNYVEKVDTDLLSKVAVNIKIRYTEIIIEESSSINFNDTIIFLLVSFKTKGQEKINNEDLGDFFQRKYLFVEKLSGKIIAEETDNNLSFYDNEALEFSKTYVLKNLIKLNETTNAIGLVTEEYTVSRTSLYSKKIFTIITLVNNKIKKILYEYPIRKTNGESNGGGTFQMEVLETDISISSTKTNGINDLVVVKTFSYEDEVEENLEKGIKGKIAPVKIKKESQRIQYDKNIYFFKNDDEYRFLEWY